MAYISLAHVGALSDANLIGTDAAAAIADGISATAAGTPAGNRILELVSNFDRRAESLSAPEVAGGATIGREPIETAHTIIRMELRDRWLDLDRSVSALQEAFILIAQRHSTTLMPGVIDQRPAHPTTFGHLLGGIIGPLGRSAHQVRKGYELINLAPMGSGSLASVPFEIDRTQVGSRLGFSGIVENSFDSVSTIDHFEACASIIEALSALIGRFAREVEALIRQEPQAVRVREEDHPGPNAGLLHQRDGFVFRDIAASVASSGSDAAATRTWCMQCGYGPTTALDTPFGRLVDGFCELTKAVDRLAETLGESFDVNRAWLANQAGKHWMTSGDIATYLMVEAGISPGDAQLIGSRITSTMQEQGLGLSELTSEIVDGAAFLVLGRELGLEYEPFSRYLAPRRFVERRTIEGGPAPTATRAWLEKEERSLESRRRWLDEKRNMLSLIDAGFDDVLRAPSERA